MHFAILTCGGHGAAVGTETDAEHAPRRQERAGDELHPLGRPGFQLRAFAAHGLDNPLHRFRHRAVIVAGVDVHGTCAFKRSPGDDALAVRREIDTEDAPLHDGEFADEVGVVTNDALGDALHAIDGRHSVGAADQDFVAQRMPHQSLNTAFQGPRGDGGDVVHETLRGDLGEFHTHVAAA